MNLDANMSDENRREWYIRNVDFSGSTSEELAGRMLEAYLEGRGDGLRAAGKMEKECVFKFEPNDDETLTCLSCLRPDCDQSFVLRGYGRISTIGIHSECIAQHLQATRAHARRAE